MIDYVLKEDSIIHTFLLKITFTILNSNQQFCIISMMVDCCIDSCC